MVILDKYVFIIIIILTDILLANGDEPNLILPKFAHPLYFFFLIAFLALTEINIVRSQAAQTLFVIYIRDSIALRFKPFKENV